MGADSKIQWTDHTFNPWWGCARVSPGCEHCYAEAFAKRTGKAKWGVKEERRTFGAAHWKEPHKWNAAAAKVGERHRVFCASMADVFEDREDLEEARNQLWETIQATPHLDWLLLTKRPENFARLLPWGEYGIGPTPWRNVWLGTTVEDQKRADERIPHLLAAPAAVRFLSCEPLLGKVLLENGSTSWLSCRLNDGNCEAGFGCLAHITHGHHFHGIDWVIVGGESGPGARPFDLAWARTIVEDCRSQAVPVFVKQLGARPNLTREDAQSVYSETLLRLRNRKGGDPSEWPEDLRVREFPHPVEDTA